MKNANKWLNKPNKSRKRQNSYIFSTLVSRESSVYVNHKGYRGGSMFNKVAFFVVLTVLCLFCGTAYTAVVFSDDFEAGNLNAWDGQVVTGGAVSADGMLAADGSWCLKSEDTSTSATDAYIYKDINIT